MEKLCSSISCERKVFENESECVLHCHKSCSYYHGRMDNYILKSFHTALIEYIIDQFNKDCSSKSQLSNEDHTLILINEENQKKPKIDEHFKHVNINFNNIYFPCRDSRDPFDYLDLLSNLRSAIFNACKICANELRLHNQNLFYYECVFKNDWVISRSFVRGNINDVLFENCVFEKNVSVDKDKLNDDNIPISLFSDCTFKETLYLNGMRFGELVFNNSGLHTSRLNQLKIENCVFDNAFSLNGLRANRVIINESVFQGEVEFKVGEIIEIFILNTSFKDIFDATATIFGSFENYKNKYSELAIFEECQFGVYPECFEDNDGVFVKTAPRSEIMSMKKITEFGGTMFLSFANFRRAHFYNGLDISTANMKEIPNFLDIVLEPSNYKTKITNRETLRIIKNSFDKVGNHIEANRFYAHEMRKYKEELSNKSLTWERFIFWFNEYVSRFGQNYILPVVWMIGLACVYYVLELGYKENWLYHVYPPANSCISFIADLFNGIASSVLPFKNVLKDGMEFVSLLFNIAFAGVLWQAIVAIKRNTRR